MEVKEDITVTSGSSQGSALFLPLSHLEEVLWRPASLLVSGKYRMVERTISNLGS